MWKAKKSRYKIHTMRVTEERNQRNGIETKKLQKKETKTFSLYIEMTHHTPGKINPEQPTPIEKKIFFPSTLLI